MSERGSEPGGPGPEAYALASLAMADVVAAHDFDLRDWRVLDFIRRQSFGAGRTEVYIPRLEMFAQATRISRGNVCRILKRLERQMVIEERPQWFYGFRLPFADWKVPRRLEEVEVIEQLALFEAPAHLRGAMRESFVEQCGQGKPGGLPGLAYARGAAGHPPCAPERGVPESGTPQVLQTRTRIGYGPSSPIAAGLPKPVPDSGTAHALMQQCSNAPSIEHSCIAASGGRVPESGTARGPLSPEQQELFDQLGREGCFGSANESRNCWLGMVRVRPEVVRELLGELRYAAQARGPEHRPRNPGAWLMDKWKRWGRPNR